MQEGIKLHPDWYPTLKPSSSLEEFQQALHDAFPKCETPCAGPEECHVPCPREAEPSPSPAPTFAPTSNQGKSCHSATPGERCYSKVEWVMNTGIHSNPEWYSGLDKNSNLDEVQD